jgi:hypothetical protein
MEQAGWVQIAPYPTINLAHSKITCVADVKGRFQACLVRKRSLNAAATSCPFHNNYSFGHMQLNGLEQKAPYKACWISSMNAVLCSLQP